MGLGDVTEKFFQSIGITEERYKEVKQLMGHEPNCNCGGRKEWLNAFGDKLGVTNALEKIEQYRKSLRTG